MELSRGPIRRGIIIITGRNSTDAPQEMYMFRANDSEWERGGEKNRAGQRH